jgi:DNA-binding MarR family transcriptional regulator
VYGDEIPSASTVSSEEAPDYDGEPSSAAWRAFLSAHARVIRILEVELAVEQQLALADYDVMLQLSEAPGLALRMHDLAASVLLSRSGLTRLVDRLVRDGYVAREPYPDDHRGKLAVLTAKGQRQLLSATPVHLRGVRQHVTSRLSAAELDVLRRLMDRLG